MKKRDKRLHELDCDWRCLPNGAFVGQEDQAYLVLEQALLLWSPHGYQEQLANPEYLITPPSIVAAMQSGYKPVLHDSALPR